MKLRLKQGVKDALAVILFYGVIILGMVLLYQKSVDADTPTQNTNVNLNS